MQGTVRVEIISCIWMKAIRRKIHMAIYNIGDKPGKTGIEEYLTKKGMEKLAVMSVSDKNLTKTNTSRY